VPLLLSFVIQAKAKNLPDELSGNGADPVSAPVLDDSGVLKDAWFS
jgi:hypothetical protein